MDSKEALARANYIRKQIEDGIASDEFTTDELISLYSALKVLVAGIDAEHQRRAGRGMHETVH